MARTIAAALAAAASPDFDAAVGLMVAPYPAAPTDPEIALAFSGLESQELHRMALTLAKRLHRDPTEADDAVQDGLLELWANQPELFRESANSWLGRLYEVARSRLREIRPAVPALSIDAMLEHGDNRNLIGSRNAVPETNSAEEESRYARPPSRGECWSREQILGAIQRYRDHHGQPPKAADFRAINGLPSLSVLYRHFETLADAVLSAGMVPGSGVFRRRSWTPVIAARECRAFRRRHARWPNSGDTKRRGSGLPSTSVMIRCFGGTRSIDVGLGAESILEAVGEPTA